jgi:GAF domain-containing protein
VTASLRPRRLYRGAEVALAFGVAAASFAVVAVLLAVTGSDVLATALGVACAAAVVVVARAEGIPYAAPVAIAFLVAFDWYEFPPTHPHTFPDSSNLANLFAYLAVGVLIGQLAEHAGRRADTSEVARSKLASEQAALRRVATLVARGAPPDEVFSAVAGEAGVLLEADGAVVVRYDDAGTAMLVAGWSAPGYDPAPLGRVALDGFWVAREVLHTRRAARVDDYTRLDGGAVALAQPLGIRSAVGAPIVVDGRPWGAMVAWSVHDRPLPAMAEARLADFTELVAAAISNTTGREELARLADEQTALRRVATLVARDVAPDELFAAVTEEVGRLLGTDLAGMIRYESDDTMTAAATWAAEGEHIGAGGPLPLDGGDLGVTIAATGRPGRIDDYADVPGRAAAVIRDEMGVSSSAGSPIVVDGHLWGALLVHSTRPEPLPADTEARLLKFSELVATAMGNAQARAQAHRLADEQAALRRVATLVAQGVPAPEVFAAVARELGLLLDVEATHMVRYDPDGHATAVAGWGTPVPVGTRSSLEGDSVTALVRRTARPARREGYDDATGRGGAMGREMALRSSAGAPIVVDGHLWGVMLASSTADDTLPADTESRIAAFTELVATAIANTEARAEVERLADEQAALRRVATLVARESPPARVFAAVAEEVGRLLRVDLTKMYRYEADGTATVVADWGGQDPTVPVGSRTSLEGDNVAGLARRTGRPARIDDYAGASGSIGVHSRELGIRAAVAAPIVVEGRPWGAMVAGTLQDDPLPPDTESRIGQFTELVATAISNMQARSDLAASRARIVAATDDERRRVVRELHDGAQQRLVHTVVTLKLARRALDSEDASAAALVTEALDHAQRATIELRELAHGIIPVVLSNGGLRAGVDALASRMPVPVERSVTVDRLPSAVEATAYFVVAEALTNVARHAGATRAEVKAHIDEDKLRIDVRDDGIGGARSDGSGLSRLGDRVAALDGRLWVESPPDGGTRITATIPLRRRMD